MQKHGTGAIICSSKKKDYPYRKHFYNIQQMPYFQLYLFFNPTISTYGTILENNDRRRNGAGRGRATKTGKNSRQGK